MVDTGSTMWYSKPMEPTTCEGEWKPAGYGDNVLRCSGCREWLVIIDNHAVGLAPNDVDTSAGAWVLAQAVKITVEATS